MLKTFSLVLVQMTFTIICVLYVRTKDKQEMDDQFKKFNEIYSWNTYVVFGSYLTINCTRLGLICGLDCLLSLVFNLSMTWMILGWTVLGNYGFTTKNIILFVAICIG